MLSSQTKNPLDYLDGMPPYLMMQMEERLDRRIREEVGLPPHIGRRSPEESDTFLILGDIPEEGEAKVEPWTDERVEYTAHWILRRMMEQRINDGRQFDSILECSRRAFATAMMMSAIERSGEAQPNEPRN
jgi:hypothetical protein